MRKRNVSWAKSDSLCSIRFYVPEEEGGSEWQGPSKMEIETMVWDLPVNLYTTYPNHAAQASKQESTVRGSA